MNELSCLGYWRNARTRNRNKSGEGAHLKGKINSQILETSSLGWQWNIQVCMSVVTWKILDRVLKKELACYGFGITNVEMSVVALGVHVISNGEH